MQTHTAAAAAPRAPSSAPPARPGAGIPPLEIARQFVTPCCRAPLPIAAGPGIYSCPRCDFPVRATIRNVPVPAVRALDPDELELLAEIEDHGYRTADNPSETAVWIDRNLGRHRDPAPAAAPHDGRARLLAAFLVGAAIAAALPTVAEWVIA